MIEEKLMETLLRTVPPDAQGMLPFDAFRKTPEWATLLKRHSDGSIAQTLSKRWKNKDIAVQPTPVNHLNHAYNFCPSCGFKLN